MKLAIALSTILQDAGEATRAIEIACGIRDPDSKVEGRED